MDNSKKHHVKFFGAAENTSRTFAAAKYAFDLMATVIQGATRLRSGDSLLHWWNAREITEAQHQRAGFISIVGTIHEQMARPFPQRQCLQELAPLARIEHLALQQRKIYGRSSIHGNQMKLCLPSAARLFDGSTTVSINARIPSRCTLTDELSSLTASIWIGTI